MVRRFALFVLTLLLVAAPMGAATYGTLKVTVADSSGAPIPGATVEAKAPTMIGTRTDVTDASGSVTISGLVPGTYSVAVSLEGFQTSNHTVRVSQNETAGVSAKLGLSSMAESITVSAEAPVVETTKATISDHVTLEEVEALPVGRDYKAYAQLVAGVSVVPNAGGVDTPVDPSSKGGNNYTDRGTRGATGGLGSRDNQYYLDGLNITDMGNGRGTMTFNNEVILEQEIITSGVPAEFGGGRGFVGNIVTKSGGNNFSGSVNYYLQTPDMYGDFDTDDRRLYSAVEDKYDAGATFGGPIVRDRLWFFTSGQVRQNTNEVRLSASATPNGEVAEYLADRKNYFGKLTLRPTENSTLTGQYFSDPRKIEGSQNVNLPVNRHEIIDDTPTTMSLTGQLIPTTSFIIDARVGSFEEEYFQQGNSANGPQNTLVYEAGRSVPAYQRQFGGAATNFTQIQKKFQADLAGTYLLQAMGSHTIKAGYQLNDWEDSTNSRLNFGQTRTSIPLEYRGITFKEAQTKRIFVSDYASALTALNRAPTSAAFKFADKNGDGVVSQAEFDSLTFTSTTGNPHGLNFQRTIINKEGENNVTQTNNVAYVQDDWVMGAFAVNAGVRMEDLEYVASDGSLILDMDPTFSPRLGLTYDIGGQGRQKVSAFYGKYYDPLRMDMVHFAGNVSGRVLGEELFIGDSFFQYRTRGRADVRDAAFAPNLKNQTQEEISLTYGINLGPTLGFTAQGYQRKDTNLIEDYDPYVYFSGDRYHGTAPANLILPPEVFGYPSSGLPGLANFFLGNLIGAERETRGIDLALERRFQNSWAGSIQYSYKDAEGNTNSDANADLQGDLAELDPRQPYMYGNLPGTIPHQVKLYGMYRTPFNLEVGGLAYYSSGAYFTETDVLYIGIHQNHDLTPGNDADFQYTKMGAEQHPSYTLFDMKFRYVLPLRAGMGVDLFLDVYNALDNQQAIYLEQSHNDATFTRYREDRTLLEPRRFQVGARLKF